MITGLALSNFKSIGKTLIVNDDDIAEGKLEFAPLTIFCGRNSSGKSTVLQSILLLAQTLQNNVSSQTLVLNGPMVKLGSVNDIDSTFSTEKDIAIDIDFDMIKPIEEIHKCFKKDICTEEEVTVENHRDPVTCSLSNDLDEIEKAIFSKTGIFFDLSSVEWELDTTISKSIKDLMNKHQVNYSMTINRDAYKGVHYKIEINKRCGDEWFSVILCEIYGKIITKRELNEFALLLKSEASLRVDSLQKEKTIDKTINQNMHLNIVFDEQSLITGSNIMPIIEKICFQIQNGIITTNFSALHADKDEKIITKDNDFEYYQLDNVTNERKINNLLSLEDSLLEPEPEPVGLKVNHFLPEKYAAVKKLPYEYAKRDFYILIRDFTSLNYPFSGQAVNEYNNTIKDFLVNGDYDESKILEKFAIPENAKIDTIDDFVLYVKKSIDEILKTNILSIIGEDYLKEDEEHNRGLNLNPELHDDYRHPYETIYDPLEPSVQEGVSDITDFFQNHINYVGPLREEPHLQYNGYVDSLTNIGTKGQHCAAVFYHNKDKIIKYIDPVSFKQSDKMMEPQKEKLDRAFKEWLNYVGVSMNIDVTFGRNGYELKINKQNSDLTNVGVGVSQVLPIVLACLLAPEKSTIIIEQPELHLHPAMQTKLTDFFIATMLCDKQLIIETHSEHIINRLRLRTVSCQTDKPINENLKIYFTETLNEDTKEYKAGNTTFRPLGINQYAAMSDWPEGFFDESQLVHEEIIEAVSKKLDEDSPDE